MAVEQGVIIRPYGLEDCGSVRAIAYNTALLGEPAEAFFDGRDLIEDFLTEIFLDYEPEMCFVAEKDGQAIGYLLGSKNIAGLKKAFSFRVIREAFFEAIAHGLILKKKNLVFLFNCLSSYFKGEFCLPDFSREYPATLHINIKTGFRNQGIGSRLVSGYLGLLAGEKITGVHFATLSDQAARFYDKLGFTLLFKNKRSYLRHILHRDLTCYVYGKKLGF